MIEPVLLHQIHTKLSLYLHDKRAANKRTVFSLKKNGKVPRFVLDGMTSDVDGNLFITTFGGNKVIKIDPK